MSQRKQKKEDPINTAMIGNIKPKFVALMASENRIMLADLLKRLKWRRDKNVTPEHILRHKFSHTYSKSVEAPDVYQKKSTFFSRRR